MAIVRPFRALRFTEKAGEIRELVCPPYDIISEEQRLSYLKRNPHNIIRLELPRDGGNPYQAAGDTLRGWLEEGILRQDGAEAFYLYEIAFTVPGVEGPLAVSGLIAHLLEGAASPETPPPCPPPVPKAAHTRIDLSYEVLLAVLQECRGNRTQAAAKLGISRGTLWRLLKKYQGGEA